MRRLLTLVSFAIISCAAASSTAAGDGRQAAAGADLRRRIAAYLTAHEAELIDVRRQIHRHPEVSGREVETAALVAARLEARGLDVRRNVGGHGVVAMLNGGRPGPLVAYRADMDAVPSTSPDPAAVKSEIPGVRHICGHDVHVAVAIGLASALASVRADLPGRVLFIFQPSEEVATGARAMLDAGLFAKETPVAIYGVHAAPLEAGTLSSRPGVMMNPARIAPGVTNDAALFERAIADLVGETGRDAFTLLSAPPAGFSEDFGEFQKQVPGVFFFLGLSNAARGIRAMPHAPDFDVDESAIAFGARAMAAVIVGRLQMTLPAVRY